MKNYLHTFENDTDFYDVYNDDSKYNEPFVSDTLDSNTVHYNKYPNSFIFEILTNGYIEFKATDDNVKREISYQLNDGEWTTIMSSTSGARINVAVGDKLKIKGNNASYANSTTSYNSFSGSTAQFNLLGNLLFLLPKDKQMISDYTFANMFLNCSALRSIEHLKITIERTAKYSCYRMFKGCTNITALPHIFTILYGDEYALKEMFMGCTALQDNIESAYICENLETHACESMFENCTSIMYFPKLMSTKLANSCYKRMFYNCSNLLNEEFYCDILDENCCESMFENCINLLQATKLFAIQAKTACYKRMFAGCSSLEKSPIIEINDISESTDTFKEMFYNCTNLNEIFIENYTKDTSNQFTNWVYNVAQTGTFHKNESATFSIGNNGIPTSWVIKNLNFREIPFTIRINKGKGNFAFNFSNSFRKNDVKNMDLYYSLNGSERIKILGNETLNLISGDTIALYGNHNYAMMNYHYDYSYYTYETFIADSSLTEIEVYGNVLSMTYADDFYEKTTEPSLIDLEYFFYNMQTLTYAHNLILPNTLGGLTYRGMFDHCYNLKTIPMLPATDLTRYAYANMFSYCREIISLPQNLLPATTLADYCYAYMFYNCRLTSLPEHLLPATTLAEYCYYEMFNSNNFTELPEHLLPAMTLTSCCYYYMFSTCTGLTSLPEGLLPATTLADYCYAYMFYNCRLTSLPEYLLPATTLASYCYEHMFYGNNFTELPEHLLPATTLAKACYQYMFAYCYNLVRIHTNFLPATTLASECYRYMFASCYNIEYGPNLQAQTSYDYCYNSMFGGAYRLRYISVLLKNISGTYPVSSIINPNWNGTRTPVYSTFVFVKDIDVPFNSFGISDVWNNFVVVNKDNLYTEETTYKVPTEAIISRINITADVRIHRIQMSQYDESLHPSLTEFTVDPEYVDYYHSYMLELYLEQIDDELSTYILFENFDENNVKISEYKIYFNRTKGKFFDFNLNGEWESASIFTGNDSPSWQNLTLSDKGTRTAKIQLYGYTNMTLTVKPGATSQYYHLVVSKVNSEAKFPDTTTSTTSNTWTSYNKSTSDWYNVTFSSLNNTVLNTIELKWGSNSGSNSSRCYAYISSLQ